MACSIDEIIANKNNKFALSAPEIADYIATLEMSKPRIVSIIRKVLYKFLYIFAF